MVSAWLAFIGIPWAATGILLAIGKPLAVVIGTCERIKDGKRCLSAVADSVREAQTAEATAFRETASAFCGGSRAPEVFVKAVEFGSKAVMSQFTPSVSDVVSEFEAHGERKG